MGIGVDWDNEAETVLRVAFDAQWTWDELEAVTAKVKSITDSAEHEIAAIIDLSQGVHLPGSLLNPVTMSHARKLMQMGDSGDRRGPVVVVSTSPLIRTIYNGVRSMDSHGLSNVSFAQTLDAARAALKARDYAYELQNAHRD